MSAFEQQLNEENEKRGLKQAGSDASSAPSKKKFFSFSAFLTGIALGLVFLTSLSVWAWLQADYTLEEIQSNLPSKTAIVKKGIDNAQSVSVQPVLTMKPAVPRLPDKQIDETPPEQNISVQTDGPLSRNKNEMVSAPADGLFEAHSNGVLPIIRKSDNLSPFEAYKRPFTLQEGKIKLSVVIMDAGLSQNIISQITKDFSPDITLAFSPYATGLKSQVDQVREQGHETWLVLPMETNKYPIDDPGPNAILLNASVTQNKQRLTTTLASANGYIGFISQKNHAFRAEDSMTNPSISEIFERGLAIVDSNTNVSSFVARAAEKNNYPHAKNNFWLDENLTPLALNQKIRQLIEYGQINDQVIIMLNPYPASLKALKKFLNSEAAKDFQLAPLSSQVVYG